MTGWWQNRSTAEKAPMQVPKQLLSTLVALVVTYLASVIEAVNLVSAAQVGLEMGIVEVPDLPADSAFAYRKRLQPGHLVLERLEAKAGCLESPEIDEVLARALRLRRRIRPVIGETDV
jgi:hypothetical protein